jgi:hypothetical protein
MELKGSKREDEIPITKFQAPNKFQLPNPQIVHANWNLEIGYYLVIDAWSLVIIFYKWRDGRVA